MADRSLRFPLISTWDNRGTREGRRDLERFHRDSRRMFDRAGEDSGRRYGMRLSRSLGGGMTASAGIVRRGAGLIAAGFAAAGVAQFAKDSVTMAATFDKTMRQTAQVAKVPAASIGELRKVALDMGAKTSFSARQAGEAMLELGKGGLTFAEQKAGGLASTLTLAAAGGLELGEAAGFIVQGLRTFGLRAGQAADVAASLAGAANASTASVQDMGLSLSQAGAQARNAGLTIEETTGVLAAFANNGIAGSDAGTSLKTMLQRLVPTTNTAKDAMRDLGLKFTDAHGAILPVTEIAQRLQDRLKGLSQAQRIAALNTIFGSDAIRAASILMREGSAGLAKYIKATSDRAAAEKLAKTNTDGAAGAFERLSGAVETLQIRLGTLLLPKLADAAEFLSGRVIPAVEQTAHQFGRQLVPEMGRVRLAWDQNRSSILAFVTSLTGTNGQMSNTADAARSLADTLEKLIQLGGQVADKSNQLGNALNWLARQASGEGGAADKLGDLLAQAFGLRRELGPTAQDLRQVGDETRRAAGNADGYTAALRRERSALSALTDALRAEKDADLERRQAKLNVEAAQKRLNEVSKTASKRTWEYRQAELDLEFAQNRLRGATDRYKDAAKQANAATSGAMQTTQRASAAHQILARRYGDSGRAARHFGDQVRDGLLRIPKGRVIRITATFGFHTPPDISMHDIVGAARGMKITTGRGPTADDNLIRVSKGETVVSADDSAQPEFQSWAKQRRIPGFQRGGIPAGGVGLDAQFPSTRRLTHMIDQFEGVIDRGMRHLADRFDRMAGARPPHAPGGWKVATQFLSALGIPYSIVSTFRPGARTHASGRQSYHALNRAVDLDGGHDKMRIWSALTRTNPTELIYSRAPYYISRRGRRPIGALDPITRADHYSHVHAAYDKGGWLMPGTTVAHNATGRPEKVLGPSESYGAVNLTVNVHNHGPIIGSPQEFAREVTPQIRRHLKDQLRREGKTALANQL